MTILRIFVSYEATDEAFATQLITDLRQTGADVVTASSGLDAAALEQFLNEYFLHTGAKKRLNILMTYVKLTRINIITAGAS